MKKCKNCLVEVEDNVNFCPECGNGDFELSGNFVKEQVMICKSCTLEVPMEANFCSFCGSNDFEIREKLVPVEEIEETSVNETFNVIKDKTVEKLKAGKQEGAELFNAMKNDVSESEFIKITKEKAKGKFSALKKLDTKKKIIIVAVLAVVVAAVVIVSNINECFYCGETILGGNKFTNMFGEEHVICRDCSNGIW